MPLQLTILILFLYLFIQQSFKQQQLTYPRVRTAYTEYADSLKNHLQQHQINLTSNEIFLRAFKKEKTLELWSKNKSDSQFVFIQSYPFCVLSGMLGPKRRQGDGQVPEGVYHINRFNPQSNFYLSLGINYPNASDKILGTSNPGGDIFIHGSCVSIGCIPITDNRIKELYVYCVEARNNGQQQIPVHIFPARLSQNQLGELLKSTQDIQLQAFWQNLQPVYTMFETDKKLRTITISKEGRYMIAG